MKLHLLPTRPGGAAENMALDFLLLPRHPEPAAARFRHYEWRRPAATFGFGQKIEFVRRHLPGPDSLDLCRRPTGGGIVDHRHDWTYALVIPRGHALFGQGAIQSYRSVHACLAGALTDSGQPAEVKMRCAPADAPGEGDDLRACPGAAADPPAGLCFARAELYDVVNPQTGAKIAGAAQKRNKHGLLLQGSVDRAAVGPVDWDDFSRKFAGALGRALEVGPEETPWPEFNDEEVSGLIEQYSSREWLEYR